MNELYRSPNTEGYVKLGIANMTILTNLYKDNDYCPNIVTNSF